MKRVLILVLAAAAVLQAQSAKRAQTTDERIATIERALKQDSKNVALQNELAGAFLQKMRETADGAYLDRASRITTAILKTDPSNYDARRRILEIEMQRHHFRQVADSAQALTRERPDDPVLWGLLGDAWMEMGEYELAPDAYQKMVDLRPGLASYNRVAFYRFVTGDAEGAIAMMRKAIAIGTPVPENVAWCWVELGNMLLKAGAVDDSETAYREALDIFPGFHRALGGLGRTAVSQGRFEEAVEMFRKAQAIAPFPEYGAWLAKLYGQMGKADLKAKQIEMLDVADRLNNAAGECANRNLALAFADLNHDLGRALEIAQAELAIRHDVYTYDALAWVLYKNGHATEARSAMQKALAQNTPEPLFREHAAQILSSTASLTLQ